MELQLIPSPLGSSNSVFLVHTSVLPDDSRQARARARGMVHNDGHGLQETDESREIREEYNRRHAGASNAVAATSGDFISLPCPAGVVWVDLSEMAKEGSSSDTFNKTLKQHNKRASDGNIQFRITDRRRSGQLSSTPDNSFIRNSTAAVASAGAGVGGLLQRMGVRRTAAQLPLPSAAEGKGGMQRQHTVFFGAGRRKREGSGTGSDGNFDAGSQSSHDADDARERAVSEETVAIELLNFRLPPKQGAEEAKLAATRSAQLREEYVAQEMQVRQMWRIAMGNAPGLKVCTNPAIARLRARCVSPPSLHCLCSHVSFIPLQVQPL